MRRADLLENGMLQWQCRIDMDHLEAEEATAVIHVPCSGSASMVVQICEIDCLPCGPDEFGDNAVILKIAHGPDPFPDLGKIVIACEQLRRERNGTPAQGDVRLGAATLKALAQAWGLDV